MKSKIEAKSLLWLMEKSGSVRKFKNRPVSLRLIKLILKAGLWGPSIFGIQPWHLVVIREKNIIKKISSCVISTSKEKRGALQKLLELAARIMKDSNVLIAVYVDNRIKGSAKKLGGKICMEKGWMAELLSAGAVIQNMLLIANSIGLGCVWLDAPTIFPNKINEILNSSYELVSFIAIGHPNQKIKRSHRNPKTVMKFL